MKYFDKLLGIFCVLLIPLANNGEQACVWYKGDLCDPCKAKYLNDQIKQQLAEHPKVYETNLELDETFNKFRDNLESAMIKEFLPHDGCQKASLALEQFQEFMLQYTNVRSALESLLKKVKKIESDSNTSEKVKFEAFQMIISLEDSATIDAAMNTIRKTRKFLKKAMQAPAKNDDNLKDSTKPNNDKKISDKAKPSVEKENKEDKTSTKEVSKKDKASLNELIKDVQKALEKVKDKDMDKDKDEDKNENSLEDMLITDSKQLDNILNGDSAGQVHDKVKETFDKEIQTSDEEISHNEKASLKELLKAVKETLDKLSNHFDKYKDKNEDKDANALKEMLIADSKELENLLNSESPVPLELIIAVLENLSKLLKKISQNKTQEGAPLNELVKTLGKKIASILKELLTPGNGSNQNISVDTIININKQVDHIFIEHPRKSVHNIKLSQVYNEKRRHLLDYFLLISATADDVAEAKKAIKEFLDFDLTYNVVSSSLKDTVERLKIAETDPNLAADVKFAVVKCIKEIEMCSSIGEVENLLKNCENITQI